MKSPRKLLDKLAMRLPKEQLREAFYHSSYVNENEEEAVDLQSNERLEFLGDAVIDLSISEYLFDNYPRKDEGQLSKIKSVVVSQPILAGKARELELGQYLYLGKGEEESGGRVKPSILCDAYEALVGVIFQSQGFDKASKFVLNCLVPEIEELVEQQNVLDYKSALQIQAQRHFDVIPDYRVVREKGKAHERVYDIVARLKEYEGRGRGRSKKEAEQAAAKQLYLTLQQEEDFAPVAQ